jgi:predicted amidophosphoribosyltransferase
MAWTDLPGLALLVDLLCPPRCALCDAETEGGRGLRGAVCDPCAETFSADGTRCLVCGEPQADDGPCLRCRTGPRVCDGIAVLTAYSDETRTAVLRAKRPSGDPLAAALAALLVRKHRDTFAAWGIEAIVPVPMHWLRRATRGTSAADEIARGVAAGLGVPWRRHLRRSRSTPMQNELPVEERWGNVRGAFRARGSVAGRRLLLVDDVTTTGATLADCRRALVEAGASAVYAGVVARADRVQDVPT